MKHGPGDGSTLSSRRVTEGVRRDGSRFKIVDSRKLAENAHRILPFEWRGYSSFLQKKTGNNMKALGRRAGEGVEVAHGGGPRSGKADGERVTRPLTDDDPPDVPHVDSLSSRNPEILVGDRELGKGGGNVVDATTAAAIGDSWRCNSGKQGLTATANHVPDDEGHGFQSADPITSQGENSGGDKRMAWPDMEDSDNGHNWRSTGSERWL